MHRGVITQGEGNPSEMFIYVQENELAGRTSYVIFWDCLGGGSFCAWDGRRG